MLTETQTVTEDVTLDDVVFTVYGTFHYESRDDAYFEAESITVNGSKDIADFLDSSVRSDLEARVTERCRA